MGDFLIGLQVAGKNVLLSKYLHSQRDRVTFHAHCAEELSSFCAGSCLRCEREERAAAKAAIFTRNVRRRSPSSHVHAEASDLMDFLKCL